MLMQCNISHAVGMLITSEERWQIDSHRNLLKHTLSYQKQGYWRKKEGEKKGVELCLLNTITSLTEHQYLKKLINVVYGSFR